MAEPVVERVTRLEGKVDNLNLTVTHNHTDAMSWRGEMTALIKEVVAEQKKFTSLLDQAKGARWLGGTIVTVIASLSLLGLKSAIDWFLGR